MTSPTAVASPRAQAYDEVNPGKSAKHFQSVNGAETMARRILLLGCLTTLLACADVAEAQRRVPGYRSRPVLSPYINLFRGDNAGLNSYFSVVRPQQVLSDYINQTNFDFAQQQMLIDQRSLQLQQELEQGLQAETGLQQRPTTGTGAMRRPAGTFMNYSTFFRGNTAGPSSPMRVRR
jgi:hypothetical protein